MRLKYVITIMMCFVVLIAFSGCSDSDNVNQSDNNVNSSASMVSAVLQPTEYTLYQNIFFNDQGSDYENTSVTKKGTFTIIYDEYNSRIRYYIWGYNDQTRCCDWQWEFVPENKNDLPSAGALVEITGIFKADENALDGYWIEDADLSVLQDYNNSKYDIDLTTMGGTLERVQIANLQNFPEKFEGKTLCVYGRVETLSTLQHPYYNNCFSLEFETENKAPAIGTVVVISGTYSNSKVTNSEITQDSQYNQVIV